MSREFEPQWSAAYMSRCFPWSLNYASGGADYPPLFQRRVEVGADANAEEDMEQPWRRKHGEALLRPGPYAQMLACRPEMQIAGELDAGARSTQFALEIRSLEFCVYRLQTAVESRFQPTAKHG